MFQLEKGVLNLYLIISILNISYNHVDAFKWYSSVKEQLNKARPLQTMEMETQCKYLQTIVLIIINMELAYFRVVTNYQTQ